MDDNGTYEEQLLAVFESCSGCEDGSLGRSGLQQLCEKLQLEEQSSQLLGWLLGESEHARVTFQAFHDALLKLLNRSRMEEEGREGGVSPAREVSPKYIFGKKKYGRRSRPENSEGEGYASGGEGSDSGSSDGEHTISKKRKTRSEQSQASEPGSDSSTPTEPVSSTTNEEELLVAAWSTISHDTGHVCLSKEELVRVFECVGLESGSDEAAQRVFEKLEVAQDGRITLQDLVDCVRNGGDVTTQSQPCAPQQDKVPSLEFLDASPLGSISGSQLLEHWEHAGVPGASQLLHNLGQSATRPVDLPALASVLSEELKTMSEGSKTRLDPLTALLRASLVLHQVYVQCLKTSVEHMLAEREKLRNDVVEANHRALLLAQEVDEHHTKLEYSTQRQVRELEQRHSEKLRELALQVKTDQEQLAAQNTALENKVERLEAEETKCRNMLVQLQLENNSLEAEHQTVLDQLAQCHGIKEKLEKDLESLSGLQHKLSEMEANLNRNEMMSLLKRITSLEEENRDLRDKNDELGTEVETLTAQLHSTVINKKGSSPAMENAEEGVGDETVVGGTKRRGVAFQASGSNEDSGEETDSPRLGKVRRCEDFETGIEGLQIHSLSHGESLEDGLDQQGSAAAVNLVSDGNVPFAVELQQVLSGTDRCNVLRQIEEKLEQLNDAQDEKGRSLIKEITELIKCGCPDTKGDPEKKDLKTRCKELETSLELMKEEYEKTEDYWAGKLDEERVLFEQEQKQSDEKYGELLEKIMEYDDLLRMEREQKQRLETIDERVSLEKQVADIEEEYTAMQDSFTEELQQKEAEIERLKKELQDKKDKEASKADAMCQAGEDGRLDPQTRRCKGSRRSLTFSSGDRKLRYCPCCRSANSNTARLSVDLKSLQENKLRLQREVELLLGERGALYKEVLEKRRELGSYMASIVSAGGGSRAQYLEQRCHSLMVTLQQQQMQTEELLNSTWKQHKAEVRELKQVLKATEEKLRTQTDLVREQLGKLARTDGLVKDLFVENSYLLSNVHRLEQQCHAYKTGEFSV